MILEKYFDSDTYLLGIVTLLFFINCSCSPTQQSDPPRQAQLYDSLPVISIVDTLYFDYEQQANATGKEISTADLFAFLGDSVLEEINDFPEIEGTTILGEGCFEQAPRFRVCMVNMAASWMIHNALLLIDTKSGELKQALRTASMYGGDGSQIFTESWLYDADRDGDMDLLSRHASRSIQMDEESDDVKETYDSELVLNRWDGKKFKAETLEEAPAFLKDYPVEW